MPKTKKDLMYALADRIGGAHGQQMREAISKPLFEGLKSLDQVYSDEEFSTELDKMEHALKAAFAKLKSAEWGMPGTWGLPN